MYILFFKYNNSSDAIEIEDGQHNTENNLNANNKYFNLDSVSIYFYKLF